jgi:hypothetical protein
MADGFKKPISEVKVGDKVLASDPETGETAVRPVTKLIVHSGKHTMVDVHLADGSTITATAHALRRPRRREPERPRREGSRSDGAQCSSLELRVLVDYEGHRIVF